MPLVIVLTHYDTLCTESSARQVKVLTCALRAIAHEAGASLQSYSVADKTRATQVSKGTRVLGINHQIVFLIVAPCGSFSERLMAMEKRVCGSGRRILWWASACASTRLVCSHSSRRGLT